MAQLRFAKTLLVVCLASAGMSSACPEPKGTAVKAECSKAYEQCVLSSGVLGVCNPVDCAANQPPPCLVCRSQH